MPNMNTVSAREAAKEITTAMQAGDVTKVEDGMTAICEAASYKAMEAVKKDFEAYQQTHDERILEMRGIRTLTSAEKRFYERLIGAMKSGNPKQAFIDILTDSEDAMPETIIEDVMRNITQEHPLLSKIDAQNVGYLTSWILNTHTTQAAAWGAITDEIAKEITSGIEVVQLRQNKLSCYAILEMGMVDLGPEWLDSYIRAVLTEAMAYALEAAVVTGDGNGCPIGMDRDLTSETSGVYAQKTPEAVTDFLPETYGALVAELAVDGNGKPRSITGLSIMVNQTTYLTKIMPAVTVLNTAGQFVNTAFPIATEVIICNALDDDAAILGLPQNYFLGIGQAKSGRANSIQYSDEYKFIEDQRVFKTVNYADGRAVDNTSFILLDVSSLEAAVVPVSTTSVATA